MFFGLKKTRFTAEQKKKIITAIQNAERKTSGEIHVHLSYAKVEADISASAQNYFQTLKLHESENRNFVLLYLNPSLKKFALYGDASLHEKVGTLFWQSLVHETAAAIRERDLVHGICHAVEKLGHSLKTHFPHLENTPINSLNDLSESD